MTHVIICILGLSNISGGMANRAETDQTAPRSILIRLCSVCSVVAVPLFYGHCGILIKPHSIVVKGHVSCLI